MKKTAQFSISILLLLLPGSLAFAADPAPKEKGPVIELVLVKGGCYQMGDVFNEPNKEIENETPVHEVCVKDFYLGKYEVTQDQWQKVMGDNPSENKECGKNCPVDSVSWDMAQDFIAKLNAMTKKKYRLPAEAEWEYAARSGGKDEKWPGVAAGGDVKKYAWFKENSEDKIHPVGLKKANGLGLYDMAGNVREWCQDWYDKEFYAKSLNDKSLKDNPVASDTAELRIQRGGGYPDGLGYARTTARRHNTPDFINAHSGLRLALPAK